MKDRWHCGAVIDSVVSQPPMFDSVRRSGPLCVEFACSPSLSWLPLGALDEDPLIETDVFTSWVEKFS